MVKSMNSEDLCSGAERSLHARQRQKLDGAGPPVRGVITFCILLLAASGVPISLLRGQGQSAPPPKVFPVIGFIRNSRDFDGAGCTLWPRTDQKYTDGRDLFRNDFDGRAIMNIDGRDRPLKLAASSEPKSKLKVGRRSMYRYQGDGVTVNIRYIVTGVCKPDDESCEVTNFDAVATVSTRSGVRRLDAHGICGS